MEATVSVIFDRLEQEIVTAVSRGADTTSYVLSEIKSGERTVAKAVLDRMLDDGKLLLTTDRRLVLPPQ